MAEYDGLSPGQVLADASVADFIKSLGLGIAEAQRALDTNSVEQLDAFITPIEGLGGRTLFEMGLQPAFYHYQHADISCSLQLSLRVEKEVGVDFGIEGSFNNAGTESTSSDTSETSTETGSSTRTSNRSAQIDIQTSSRGALSVGGNNLRLEGDTPDARINALAEALRNRQDIDRARVSQQCAPVNPTSTAPAERVVTSPNAVAFVGGGFDNAVIRISDNPSAADSPETYVLNGSTSVPVTRSNSVENYAIKVKDEIDATPFSAIHTGPGNPIKVVFFDFDSSAIRPEEARRLRHVAGFLARTGLSVRSDGHTDRSGASDYNQRLGQDRANSVQDFLIANGVPAGNITTRSLGESRWESEGAPDGVRNQDHRRVELILDSPDHFIFVDGDASNRIESGSLAPDKRAAGSTGNGFVYLWDPADLSSIAGQSVSMQGVAFTLNGAAVGGHAANSAEAFALNLTNAVNADTQINVEASARANVTHLCPGDDHFQLELVTSSSQNIQLSGTEGVTVTRQFTRTRSARNTAQRTGNSTVAIGASLDVRFSRQFEMNVTGNSAISARLVAVPAPPQFLETIRDFLEERNA